MDLKVFERMDHTQLVRYLEFLLWHYRVVDSFWFIYISEEHGQSFAEKLNERVWARVSEMAARDLIKRFAIADRGLKGFVKLLELYPWSILIGYKIDWGTDELVLSVPCCPTQAARVKRGLGEYNCKEMHRAEFTALARVIDPSIRVECRFAPPDEHPPDMHCQWRFWCEGVHSEPTAQRG